MAAPQSTATWQRTFENVSARAEEELRRAITYVNNEVVPDIRRDGAHALRTAADGLLQLAQRLDRPYSFSAAARPTPPR